MGSPGSVVHSSDSASLLWVRYPSVKKKQLVNRLHLQVLWALHALLQLIQHKRTPDQLANVGRDDGEMELGGGLLPVWDDSAVAMAATSRTGRGSKQRVAGGREAARGRQSNAKQPIAWYTVRDLWDNELKGGCGGIWGKIKEKYVQGKWIMKTSWLLWFMNRAQNWALSSLWKHVKQNALKHLRYFDSKNKIRV